MEHERSYCHKDAVYIIQKIPTTHRDVSEMLNLSLIKEKQDRRDMFLTILSSIRFLARQGLPLRGDGDESNGNFNQLLNLIFEQKQLDFSLFQNKTIKYTSP